MEGEISIQIDYEKFNADAIWDGLKGYVTNTKLTNDEVIENYKSLWNIERAFRMSKSNLSVKRAVELTHNMYQITYMLPQSKHTKSNLLKMDDEQNEPYNVVKIL
jgi:hypothetical protein